MSSATFPRLSHRSDPASASSDLMLDYDVLRAVQAQLSPQYQDNLPFPHIVLDDFLPQRSLMRLLAEYPYEQDLPIWNEASHKDKQTGEYVQKEKRNIRDLLAMPASYRQLVWELNSQNFLEFLEEMTGIGHLIPDPTLRGAGIHQISRGGFLKIHADFATHRDFLLDRRLNFLLYLNENWREEYGGNLELWDAQMEGPPKRVAPLVNRCVIFSTTATSFHGHPQPLTCPDGVYRKSLALYYYSNGRPAGEAEPGFATLWKEVP